MTQIEFVINCFHQFWNRLPWRDSCLPNTFRWFNTAGALLIAANQGDPNCLGGIRPGEAKDYRKILEKWWGITDHQTAIETMTDLLDNGMRARFGRTMELFEIYRRQVPIEPTDKRLTNNDVLYPHWKQRGQNALLGWDLCRAILVTSWCHVCGYISMAEMMRIALRAGNMLQKNFASWDEVMNSYLLGFFYWVDPHTAEEKRRYKLRAYLYKTMRGPRGPFAVVAFKQTLSESFSNEERERLQIISR